MNALIEHLARTGSGSLLKDYFSPVQRSEEFWDGHRMMIDAVLSGEKPGLALILARGEDARRGTADQSVGAMAALLDCLDALRAGGTALKFDANTQWPALAVRALRSQGALLRGLLRMTPAEDYAVTLELLCEAAYAAGPHLTRNSPTPAPPVPVPLAVNVALQLPDGPLPMTIVGQPATRAVQTVERDAADEIVRTVTETAPVPS